MSPSRPFNQSAEKHSGKKNGANLKPPRDAWMQLRDSFFDGQPTPAIRHLAITAIRQNQHEYRTPYQSSNKQCCVAYRVGPATPSCYHIYSSDCVDSTIIQQ